MAGRTILQMAQATSKDKEVLGYDGECCPHTNQCGHTYCLVAIVQHDMRLERSTYEVLQILSISLTDKTHLRDLFDKTNFNDVKDQFGPLIPGLFD